MRSFPSVFTFPDYKSFLHAWVAAHPKKWGQRSRIARAASCQLAYVSQVLGGSSHFSEEQAEQLLPLLELDEGEGDHFLLLLRISRAGTASLRRRLERKRDKEVEGRGSLAYRLQEKPILDAESQATYYSHWAYSAFHMAVRIPSMRSSKALELKFGLGRKRTKEILEFLIAKGMVHIDRGALVPGEARIHLGSNSPLTGRHHTNWRMRAIQSLDHANERDLHYSSVATLSKADVPKAREILVKAIEEVRKLVKDAKDETVICYLVDLFPLQQGT